MTFSMSAAAAAKEAAVGGECARRTQANAGTGEGGDDVGRGWSRNTPTCWSLCRRVSKGGVLDTGVMLLALVLFIAQPPRAVEAALNLPVQDSLLRNKQGGAVGMKC